MDSAQNGGLPTLTIQQAWDEAEPAQSGNGEEIRADPETNSNGDADKAESAPVGAPSAKRVKKPQMADVVRTMMIMRNWLLSHPDDETAEEEWRPAEDLASDAIVESGLVSRFAEKRNALEERRKSLVAPLNRRQRALRRLRKTLQFTVDPGRSYYYYWMLLVSMACLYNLMTVIMRVTFTEFQTELGDMWIAPDLISDLILLVDVFVEAKKGFILDGGMVTNPKKLALNYFHSKTFWLDLISVLPTDILYLLWPGQALLRANRLLRTHRILDFADRTETRTSFPNVFRFLKLVVTIYVVFHWNGCFFFILSKQYGIDHPGMSRWSFQYDKILDTVIPKCSVIDEGVDACLFATPANATEDWQSFDMNASMDYGLLDFWENPNRTRTIGFTNLTKQYVFSLYWSALILTTLGEQVAPQTNGQFLFVTIDILLGLLIFAAIIGNVGEMVTTMNAAKAEFEERMDGVKQYMEYRRVNAHLQKHVMRWFNYIWTQKQLMDEENVLNTLPTRLKAELAIQVHLDTLKRVRIFQDCEPGLLVELVLKLKLQVFSPGDYICRKGDVGKEMYIVKRGSLNVVAEDGIVVFVTLKEGSVFGELSVLDIPGNRNGNKRTASIRSVGYSDLFVLSKDDLWDALREYPEAKKLLLQKGREMLTKDNLLDEEAAAVGAEPKKSVEQRLDAVADKLTIVDENLRGLYADFSEQSAQLKRRITSVERTFRAHHKKIKRDCLLGLL